MKDPKLLSNDDLSLYLEMWVVLNQGEFTEQQLQYFEEILWRLRLSTIKETAIITSLRDWLTEEKE